MATDLYIDKDKLMSAQKKMADAAGDMETLKSDIISNLEVLKDDWDSEAGALFFTRFEEDLLNNLTDYAEVFKHISENLGMALVEYEAVFSAADAVANTET